MKQKARIFVNGVDCGTAEIDLDPTIYATDDEPLSAPMTERPTGKIEGSLTIDPLIIDDLRRSHKAPLN